MTVFSGTKNRARTGGRLLAALLLVAALFSIGWPSPVAVAQGTAAAERPGARDVILATTTSTQDSGLLDDLVPLFNEETGHNLKPIAVGSGAALELGERGEADVVLAHNPAAEAAFMAGGFGRERRTVMFNDFVLVGPADDPAGIAGAASATEAMAAIAAAEAPFVSRGDDSGTHALELRLWELTGVEPGGGWYTESGTGMGDTLNIAGERGAYTLADRGTFLSLRDRLDLEVLVEGDPALLNVYHVMTVNPENGPTVNTEGGRAFLAFLLEPATQEAIGAFGVDRFGEPLFTPCADNACGALAATPGAGTPVASPPV
ncbi:MAG: substrate-binding domain-containing protein [Chloroflexota bacterium]|nr:substrate-binding domain-containing protein [Chloroflexota bacterium]